MTTLFKRCSTLLLICTVALFSACSTPQIDDYAKEKPVFELDKYFNDTLDAYGVFTDRSGQVVKRFTVVMDWRLTRHADGRFTGTADDVVGTANGQQRGNAFYWTYTLALPVDSNIINVQFDDWMYLMNDKVMLNKASMSKWGVGLGEVTLSFVKR